MNETHVPAEHKPLPPPPPAGVEQTHQKLKLVKERVSKQTPPATQNTTGWGEISI